MTWHLVSLDAAAPHPWRNGGGVTRELLAWPPAPAPWQLRLSVADVTQPGPFSRFDGIERWFAVLDGAGVVLRVGGGAQRLTPASAAFQFSGEVPVDCDLVAGPTRDFNLMAAPGRARLHRVKGEFAFHAEGTALVAVYAHSRPARIAVLETAVDVPPRHLAWCRREWAATGTVTGEDALWLEARV